MDDPIIPLNPNGEEAEIAALPVPEQLGDPVPEAERQPPEPPAPPAQPQQPAPAAQNGAEPPLDALALEAALEALGMAEGRRRAAGPVVGDVRHLAAMQHDLEQASAEIRATRRSVQLLAISLGALAALALLYTVRGLRAQGSTGTAAK